MYEEVRYITETQLVRVVICYVTRFTCTGKYTHMAQTELGTVHRRWRQTVFVSLWSGFLILFVAGYAYTTSYRSCVLTTKFMLSEELQQHCQRDGDDYYTWQHYDVDSSHGTERALWFCGRVDSCESPCGRQMCGIHHRCVTSYMNETFILPGWYVEFLFLMATATMWMIGVLMLTHA